MYKISVAFLAGAALLATGPALAKPEGGGGSGGPPTTMGAPAGGGMSGPSSTATERANPNSPVSTTTTRSPDTTTTGSTRRDQARQNSQGPEHASPTGVAHANENSVLATGSVAADTLPGLTTGLTVNSSTGTSLGTVSQVITRSDGSIRMIVVTTSTGETVRIPATSLSISGDVVTVTTP